VPSVADEWQVLVKLGLDFGHIVTKQGSSEPSSIVVNFRRFP